MTNFSIGTPLSLDIFKKVTYDHLTVTLDPATEKKMTQSEELLAQWIKEKKTIYSVNTGFGVLSDQKISPEKLRELQLNLIRSHSVGVGSYFSEEEVRGIMLLRAKGLAHGYSGVRPITVKTLLEFLNQNIIPAIPKKGSVGASGDLAPLAHLALCLMGEGEFQNHPKSSPPILKLQGREGLALINGTQVMTAIGALNIIRMERLLHLFDIAGALSIEASLGSKSPFDPDIHRLRPHSGQMKVAKKIWKLFEKSEIQKSHENCGKIQDPYSFRCIPQVHGSCFNAYEFSKKIVETEMNSVTDNPIFFTEQKKWVNGGNFHGQYLSQAMDFLSIALSTMVNISERRIEKLLDPKFSSLPPFLIQDAGISSGLMIAHVTAAALASENKVLSHPASVDTIPTSGNKEDHVSMGVHSALKAKEILDNAETVLAIEFLAGAQGIEFRRPLKTSPHLEKIMTVIRKHIPPITKDRVFSFDIQKIKSLFDPLYHVIGKEK